MVLGGHSRVLTSKTVLACETPGHEGTGLNVIASFRDFFSDFHTPEKDNFYMIKRKYEKKSFEREIKGLFGFACQWQLGADRAAGPRIVS